MSGGAGASGQAHGNAHPHTVNSHASATAQAVQSALAQFDATRDQFITNRKALVDQLAAAKTEADRQAILVQLHAEVQAEKDQRTQLGKQIRQEMMTLRQQRKNSGG